MRLLAVPHDELQHNLDPLIKLLPSLSRLSEAVEESAETSGVQQPHARLAQVFHDGLAAPQHPLLRVALMGLPPAKYRELLASGQLQEALNMTSVSTVGCGDDAGTQLLLAATPSSSDEQGMLEIVSKHMAGE